MTGRLRVGPGATGRRIKLHLRSSPDEPRGPLTARAAAQCTPVAASLLSCRAQPPGRYREVCGAGICAESWNGSAHQSCFALVIPRITATIGARRAMSGGNRGALLDEMVTGYTFENTP